MYCLEAEELNPTSCSCRPFYFPSDFFCPFLYLLIVLHFNDSYLFHKPRNQTNFMFESYLLAFDFLLKFMRRIPFAFYIESLFFSLVCRPDQVDQVSTCAQYEGFGFCTSTTGSIRQLMVRNCPVTCGFCRGTL